MYALVLSDVVAWPLAVNRCSSASSARSLVIASALSSSKVKRVLVLPGSGATNDLSLAGATVAGAKTGAGAGARAAAAGAGPGAAVGAAADAAAGAAVGVAGAAAGAAAGAGPGDAAGAAVGAAAGAAVGVAGAAGGGVAGGVAGAAAGAAGAAAGTVAGAAVGAATGALVGVAVGAAAGASVGAAPGAAAGVAAGTSDVAGSRGNPDTTPALAAFSLGRPPFNQHWPGFPMVNFASATQVYDLHLGSAWQREQQSPAAGTWSICLNHPWTL